MGFDSKPISEQRVYAQNSPPQGRDGIIWVDTSDPDRATYVFSGETDQFEPVFDQRVFAQNTPPNTQRDGTIWVDTSDNLRPTYSYSTSTDQFERVGHRIQFETGSFTDSAESTEWSHDYSISFEHTYSTAICTAIGIRNDRSSDSVDVGPYSWIKENGDITGMEVRCRANVDGGSTWVRWQVMGIVV